MNIILCNFNDNRPRLEKIDNLNAEYRIGDVQVDEARTKQFKDLHDKEHNGNKNFKNPNIYEETSNGSSNKQNYIHPLEFRNISYDGRHYLDEVGEKALKARISQGIKNKHFLDKGENKVKYLSNDLETKLLTIPISISTPHPAFTEDYYTSFVYRNPSFKKLRYGCGVERAVYSKKW